MLALLRSVPVVLLVLALTGWVTRPLVRPAWQEVRAGEPALHAQALEATLGQGLTFGLLGGFRAVLADFLWLRANVYWENYDVPATHKMIELVTTVDPRPLYFWINGARMLAYDMPVWRYAAAEDAEGRLDDAVRRRIDDEQSQAALALLRRGLASHPNDPLLLFEAGNIHLRRRHDPAAAEGFYLAAARQPNAPYYMARLYAVLLEEQGKLVEALSWLRALHPTLPADRPEANVDWVLERIRRLEQALEIAPEQRFAPGSGAGSG